jgi:hypothetical protein
MDGIDYRPSKYCWSIIALPTFPQTLNGFSGEEVTTKSWMTTWGSKKNISVQNPGPA